MTSHNLQQIDFLSLVVNVDYGGNYFIPFCNNAPLFTPHKPQSNKNECYDHRVGDMLTHWRQD